MGSASDHKSVVTGYPAVPGAAAAYPYPPPPPHPGAYYGAPPPNVGPYYPPPSYYPAPPPYPAAPEAYRAASISRGSIILRRLIAVCIALLLLMGVTTLIVWLVLRPSIPEIYISSFSVSAFNVSPSTQQLSSSFNIALSVHNPNEKLVAHYGPLDAAVVYDDDAISRVRLRPLDQSGGSTAILLVKMVMDGAYVEENVSRGIVGERGSGDGSVAFDFKSIGLVRFESNGGWQTGVRILTAVCFVRIQFKNSTAGDGSYIGPAKPCHTRW